MGNGEGRDGAWPRAMGTCAYPQLDDHFLLERLLHLDVSSIEARHFVPPLLGTRLNRLLERRQLGVVLALLADENLHLLQRRADLRQLGGHRIVLDLCRPGSRRPGLLVPFIDCVTLLLEVGHLLKQRGDLSVLVGDLAGEVLELVEPPALLLCKLPRQSTVGRGEPAALGL